MTNKTLVASFDSFSNPPVLSTGEHDGTTYIGGADGILYRTVDGSYHDEFWRIDDGPITSVISYANAVFAGTSPEGNVYMHNFSTGNRFHYVVSGDHGVSAMCVHEDVLYVGTEPSGIILSFDGDRWNKEYESSRSVSAMVSYSGSLYIFFSDSSTILSFGEGGLWSFINDGESAFSISSKNPVSTSIDALGGGAMEKETGVSGAVEVSGKIYFSGYSRPTIYSYDGTSVAIEYQFGDGVISSISGSGNEIFVSVGDTVYVSIVAESSESESAEGEDGEDN